MDTPHTSRSPNDWERKFGNARRRIDKKLLAELERQIAKEERALARGADRNDASRRIALAFGRPLT
jgi:hypothetical protein